jgi:hypothetical protein
MPLLPVGEKNISEYGGFFRRITFSNGDYEGQAWGVYIFWIIIRSRSLLVKALRPPGKAQVRVRDGLL